MVLLMNHVITGVVEVMSGSRRFLLFLVVASLTCVVLVQISMDGKNIGRSLQYNENSSANDSVILHPIVPTLPEIHPKSTTSSVIIATTKRPYKTTKNPQYKQANLMNKTVVVQALIQVRRLPLGRQVSSSNQVLVNRQDRLQEILKQSGSHKQAILDPMRSLKSLPIAKPDKVTRIIIITYFRAGSSFFGDILQQNWKTFYHFEPLHSMTYDKRVDDAKIPDVFTLFNNIFRCNFSESTNYLQWVKKPRNQFLFAHNLFLWVTCHSNPKVCFNPLFVNAVCVRAPIHVMKVTRLHMRHLHGYLQDNPDMNLKVVYLTRDPRGIVSSRWSLDWCNGTNCSDSRVLCNEMDEDIKIFNKLKREQPSNFIKVRYEDLSMNPESETEKIFSFLKLPYSSSVKKFLKTHTVSRKVDDTNPYSTRRNSSSMAFSWRERFSYKQIENVQSQCENVLNKLNHSLITSPNQLPYPNGRVKPNITKHSGHPKTWRFNKNPLAKKYFGNRANFFQNSTLPNFSEIVNSNNTNIEVHKSYKVVANFSLRNSSEKSLVH